MGIIKRLLALDGANRVCHFRDDGSLVVGYGRMGRDEKVRLVRFSHDYRHVAQGNADQLAMFAGMRGQDPSARLDRAGRCPAGVRHRQSVLDFGQHRVAAERIPAGISGNIALVERVETEIIGHRRSLNKGNRD